MTKRKKSSKKYYYAFVAVVLIIVIAVALLDYSFNLGIINWNKPTTESESQRTTTVNEIKDLKITFIDVGQGDAILINFPDGTNMLVDAGESSAEDELDEYLTVDGNKIKLDYVVATHTDSDHIGSMDYVYENYEVGYSYRPYVKFSGTNSFPEGFLNEGYQSKSTGTYRDYLEGVALEGTPNVYFTDLTDINVSVQAGESKIEYSVDFVMPYAKTVEGFSEFTDSNDFSSVMIVEFAGRRVMLTGDMEALAEQKFVEYYEQNPSEKGVLDCDVLKVAHHGSATSSSMGFLNLIKPEYSVISCGVCHGTYMHPREEALTNLSAIFSKIYRTDLQGTVVLTITPEGEMTFEVETHQYDMYLFDSAQDILHMKDEIKEFKKTL